MGKPRKEREAPRIQRIELSEKNVKLRWILAGTLLLIGLVAIAIGVNSCISAQVGWQEVKASSNKINCAADFVLNYQFGETDLNPTAEQRQVSSCYSQAAVDAYELFENSVEGSDLRNLTLLAVLEGVLRILIFLAYVVMISAMKDIRRVYMYHGAEHKCINCIENGRELNVHNVRNSSREHKRCGTSFLLFVMVVSVVLFMFIRVSDPVWRLLIRLLLIPVIAGISYELIRLAGRSDNPVIGLLSAPGLLLQKLTTKEPDDDMIEIAIASVEAVFDWRAYLKDNFGFVAPEASGSAAEGEAAASKNSAVSAEAVSEDGADK